MCLKEGQTLGVNVFTREMSAALTSHLATVTLFDTACGKRMFVLQEAIAMWIGKRACSM